MAFPWNDITWVLLDMDGTLLDKHFDDYFWETLVPEEYARRQAMDLALARDLVFARYQREEGTLNWTDIDFWSRELELDIPALKEGIRHLIEVHPDTEGFLEFLRQKEKRVALVTNAHYKTLSLKMNHTGLLGYFDEVVSSFDLGHPKEDGALLGDPARPPALRPQRRPCWWTTTPRPWPRPAPSASNTPTSRPNPAPAKTPNPTRTSPPSKAFTHRRDLHRRRVGRRGAGRAAPGHRR